MNRTLCMRCLTILAFILALFSGDLVASNTEGKALNKLYMEGRVQVRSWVNTTSQPFAVSEQVIVNLEVLTDTWFTSGTRVHRIEIDDALVINSNVFAINSTERINGKTFSKQHWEIVVYPLVSGEFNVPPITVELEVKDGKNKIKGALISEALVFQVSKPSPRMTSSNKWIVSSEAHVTEEWEVIRSQRDKTEREESDKLRVGDSIKRMITTHASATSGMLLPDVLEEPIENQERVSFYRHQVKNRDTEVRGEYRSQKVESATYILQQPGEIVFPSQTLYWWDTVNKVERKIELEEVKWQVSHTFYSLLKLNFYKVIAVSGAIFILGLLFFYVKKRYKSHSYPMWLIIINSIISRDFVQYESNLYKSILINGQRYRLLEEREVNIAVSEIQTRYKLKRLDVKLKRVRLLFLYLKMKLNYKK